MLPNAGASRLDYEMKEISGKYPPEKFCSTENGDECPYDDPDSKK